jgi:hypothetical protein
MPEPTRFAAMAGMHVPAGPIVTGSLMVTAATALGAWLALRRKGRQQVWLGGGGRGAPGDRRLAPGARRLGGVPRRQARTMSMVCYGRAPAVRQPAWYPVRASTE